jgi:hypothetical protein
MPSVVLQQSINERLLFMKIRLLLPAIPGLSVFNAFLAAYSSYSYANSFLGIAHVFYKRMFLSIKADSILPFRLVLPYTSETFPGGVLAIPMYSS